MGTGRGGRRGGEGRGGEGRGMGTGRGLGGGGEGRGGEGRRGEGEERGRDALLSSTVTIECVSPLCQLMESIGANKKLSLTGRPSRPIGGLGSSRVYRIGNTTMMLYPSEVDPVDFYISLDMLLLIDQMRVGVGEGEGEGGGWEGECRAVCAAVLRLPIPVTAAVHLSPLEPLGSADSVLVPEGKHFCVSIATSLKNCHHTDAECICVSVCA